IAAGKTAAEPTGVMRIVPLGGPFAGTRGAPASPEGVARDAVQRVMTRDAGVLRDRTSLERAAAALAAMDAGDAEARHLLAVGAALVQPALAREEPRGRHPRVDSPDRVDAFAGRFVFGLSEDARTAAAVPTFRPLSAPVVPGTAR